MARRIICPKCEYVGVAKMKRRGSTKMELVGWLLLFPLGIPYSIWRMFGKAEVCKSCGHDILIAEDSIVGQRVLNRIYGLQAPAEITPVASQQPVRDYSMMRPEKDPKQF